MKRRYSVLFRPVLLTVDLLLLFGCLLFAVSGNTLPSIDTGVTDNYQLLLLAGLGWVLLTILTNPYKIVRTIRIARIIRGHVTLVILHFLLLVSSLTYMEGISVNKQSLLLSYLLFAILIIIWRVSFTYALRLGRIKGYNFRNVVIVGYGEVARELRKFFLVHPEYGFRFLGYFDDNAKEGIVRGRVDDIFRYVSKETVHEIYCCLPYVRYSDINKIVEFGEDSFTNVKLITDFRGFSLKSLELTRYDQIPILNVISTPLDEQKNQIVKRTFDILFSSLVIVLVLSWLLPIIALVIKLDSKGPVFFRQIRAGKDNSPFWCYKFRTMKPNGVSDTLQATKDDPRITKVGAFLRRTSLDEMPQFFNVFLGDMSIIGPRPHPVKLNERFSDKIYKFNLRHQIKPGITGLAQIKGLRGETQTVGVMNHRVKYDRFYVEKWSLFLDIRILFSTISTLFKGDDNAY